MLKSNKLKTLHQKRTLRPLYHWNSAVPYTCFLDATSVGTGIVYPGMVATKTTGEQMAIANATDVPFGLFNDFVNGDMDELGGGTEISVWRGGPDATFEVLAGPSSTETPLDPNITWTSADTAGGAALFCNADGQLTTTDGGGPIVARLVEVISNRKIVVTLDLRTE